MFANFSKLINLSRMISDISGNINKICYMQCNYVYYDQTEIDHSLKARIFMKHRKAVPSLDHKSKVAGQ